MSVILVKTGRTVCITHLTGELAFLALDLYRNVLYAAGSGVMGITALNTTPCVVQHIFEMECPVYGLAVSVVPANSSVIHQLWIVGFELVDNL